MNFHLSFTLWAVAHIAACHGARYVPPANVNTTLAPLLHTSRFTPVSETPQLQVSSMPPVCQDAINTTNPLGKLRAALRNSSNISKSMLFHAYIIFYSDEHLSEEPSPDERRLQYISGWGGPGTGVVLADGSAALWVSAADERRARATLSCAWVVVNADDPNQLNVAEWIATKNLSRNGRVGADARLTSVGEWEALSTAIKNNGLQLIHKPNLIDTIWNEETDQAKKRAQFSKIVAKLHNPKYTGLTWLDKIYAVREELKFIGADAMVVTALDEVAWLLNIRGRDLPYAPLLKAFVVVSSREVKVYAPPGKLSMPVRDALAVYNCHITNGNCTRVLDYTNIYADLRRATESKILIPAGGTFQRGASAAIAESVSKPKQMIQISPIIYMKAQKNSAEIRGMKRAHLGDAVAMCTLFSYMEKSIKGQTEYSVSEKVDMTRATQATYIGPSMSTRVSFGPNGAIPDYVAAEQNSNQLFKNSTLIIQSGGQYDEGTTVLTRTLHYGIPTNDEKHAYTTTLRAMAALAKLQIPATLPAAHIDPVARAPLWAAKQEYQHPTGHGVGAALNTREDPVVLDYKQDTNLYTLREGYFITSEPAWYEPLKFGVRLGNILEVISQPNGFFGFKETTLVPYEKKLIDMRMLTEYEIHWLNDYNKRIRDEVGPELMEQGMMDVYYWMMNNTLQLTPIAKPLKVSNSAIKTNERNIMTTIILLAIIKIVN